MTCALAAVAVMLSACQASQRVTVDAVTAGSTIRCANGQSFVNELSDSNPAGYGAGTEARRDLYCTNEDGGGLWWDLLDVQARKYNGNYLCETTPRYYTTGHRNVSLSASDTCAVAGSSQIHVIGTHGATRPGGGPVPRRELSLTPNVGSI